MEQSTEFSLLLHCVTKYLLQQCWLCLVASDHIMMLTLKEIIQYWRPRESVQQGQVNK